MAEYRVLIVNHAVDIGGAERVLLSFLDHLNRELFEPALACPHDGPLVEEMRKRNIPVYMGFPASRLLEVKRKSVGGNCKAVLAYPWDMASTVFKLAGLIRREGFDLVFTNSAKGDIYGSLAGWLAGRPVIWRLHDIVNTDAFSRLNVWMFKTFATLFAREVLAISQAVRDALVAQGVSEGKAKVAYNGVELGDSGESKTAQEVRAQWGIDADAPLAGMVGRLVDWKGPDYFIEAAALVADKMPEARFMLVGDAVFGERGYVDDLKRRTHELGIEDKVVFTGFRDDVSDIMECLDLLVHASILPEPFGLVLIEAMAKGTPVVASSGGGVGEIVEDGVSGMIVPPRDARAMAEAMVKVLSRPDEARVMGTAGRKRVEELFDIRMTTRKIEEEFLGVLRGDALQSDGRTR